MGRRNLLLSASTLDCSHFSSSSEKSSLCRVVVRPWHQLHTLTLSHNHLTHLDDSLQVLPSLREVRERGGREREEGGRKGEREGRREGGGRRREGERGGRECSILFAEIPSWSYPNIEDLLVTSLLHFCKINFQRNGPTSPSHPHTLTA